MQEYWFCHLQVVKTKKTDKKESKKNTEASGGGFNLPVIDGTTETTGNITTESETEEPYAEVSVMDSDWMLGGCGETGYLEVPAEWNEHKIAAEGDKYSIQYISSAQDGLISIFKNDYNYDENQNVDNPAEVIRDAFIEQYANMDAINLRTDEITINGVHFYQTVDYIPAGGIADYDYYLYTYVAYTDRFYSFVIEGDEAVIEESVEKAEETFIIADTGGYDEDNSNHSFVQ